MHSGGAEEGMYSISEQKLYSTATTRRFTPIAYSESELPTPNLYIVTLRLAVTASGTSKSV
jgi:hypothetical protein